MPEKCTSYDEYITRFLKGLRSDLQQAYQEIPVESELAVWDILTDIFQKTGEKFVFVIDEWDAIFHMPFINVEQQKEFLLFLKSLLKGKVYLVNRRIAMRDAHRVYSICTFQNHIM